MTSGFLREVDEICALMACYAAYRGNSIPTFRDNILFPSPRFKQSLTETRFRKTYNTVLQIVHRLQNNSMSTVRSASLFFDSWDQLCNTSCTY